MLIETRPKKKKKDVTSQVTSMTGQPSFDLVGVREWTLYTGWWGTVAVTRAAFLIYRACVGCAEMILEGAGTRGRLFRRGSGLGLG